MVVWKRVWVCGGAALLLRATQRPVELYGHDSAIPRCMAHSASWPSIDLAGLICNWISMGPVTWRSSFEGYLAAPKAQRKFWPSPPPRAKSVMLGGGFDPPSAKSVMLGGGSDPPSTKSVMLGGGSDPPSAKSVMLGGGLGCPHFAPRPPPPRCNVCPPPPLLFDTSLSPIRHSAPPLRAQRGAPLFAKAGPVHQKKGLLEKGFITV